MIYFTLCSHYQNGPLLPSIYVLNNLSNILIHYLGNESNQSLLEAYGIVTKDQRLSEVIETKTVSQLQ